MFSQIGIVIVDDYNKDAKANESKQMLRRTESSVVLAESADGAELESASNWEVYCTHKQKYSVISVVNVPQT